MGSLINLASKPCPSHFPTATFAVDGTPPLTQCGEARIESTTGSTSSLPWLLTEAQKFVGYNLVGKICHIITNPGGNTGNFTISANGDNTLTFTTNPGDGTPTTYYVSDGDPLQQTRDRESFAAFIKAAGYAFTIKAGILYTNIPLANLQPACTITWNPLT